MVVKIHAGDLDSIDRRLPRRRSHPRVAFANQLPVNPAGKTQLPESEFGVRWQSEAATALWIPRLCESAITFRVETEIHSAVAATLQPAHSKPKKEDQCQES